MFKLSLTSPRLKRAVVLWAIMASVLYGASYQQFLMFSTTDTRGLADSVSYLAMSHGNYDVDPVHRYRSVIPSLASLVQKSLISSVEDLEKRDKLSFFVVNFIFSLGTGILLYAILEKLEFRWEMSLLGAVFFLTSRINVMSVGAPLVDSFYFFAVAIVVYLTLNERLTPLVLLTPLLVLSKETIVPFLFLPLAKPRMRDWKMVASIMVALGVFYAFRQIPVQPPAVFKSPSLIAIIYDHLPNISSSLRRLGGLDGVHDLLNGFSLLAPIAICGVIVDRQSASPRIPGFLLLIVPLAFATALLSGNIGRMFFAAYVPVVAYALVGIKHLCAPDRVAGLQDVVGAERSLTSDMSVPYSPGRQSSTVSI